jgi:hypothetical protein
MTTIRISDPAHLEELLAELTSRPDVVATIVDGDAIRISILGSYSHEGMRLATFLRIRAWEAAQRARGIDVRVEVELTD